MLGEIIGQLFGHALGQGRDQHSFSFLDPQIYFSQQVVDLGGCRSHDNLRIDEARRTHHLLHHLPRVLPLVIGRRGRYEDRLAHHFLELVETQRPVVERRRQAEAVFHQVFLARAVAAVHAAELRDGHVALVDDHQRVLRQVVDQRRRRLARLAARQVPRVVLDALAEAELGQHLEVEARALLDALRLEQPACLLEELDAAAQLQLDRLDRAQGGLPRRDVVARRIDREARHRVQHAAGQRVEHLEFFHQIIFKGDSNRMLGMLRGEHVDDIAAHAEAAAPEVELVALVLHRHQPRQHVALRHLLALAQVQDHAVVLGGVADAVDRRHRRHDHHVAPLHQRLRRRQAHLLDVLVDRGVLLDIQVARRNVGLGLVVVVIGDEVLDRVLGEELAELGVELRGERLVGREHQRRAAEPRDDVRHGVGLAGPGHPEQRLEREAVADAFGELVDRLGLVARGLVELLQAKRTVGKRDRHG